MRPSKWRTSIIAESVRDCNCDKWVGDPQLSQLQSLTDSGVKVHGYKATDDSDEFQIYLTSGSRDSRRDLFLGTVVLENNETRFVPGAHIDEIITK